MRWEDHGIVLGTRGHGESGLILEAMTRDHGRHLGLVHGGRSKRLRPALQPGNTLAVTWHARLDEQLGTFTAEAETLRTERVLGSSLALAGIATLAAHLRLLPERDPHADLYRGAETLADHLHDPAVAPSLMALFELRLLAELGFGLDLTCCAATGRRDDLGYVSPKSGRAVSREAAAPYRDRLLALPSFFTTARPETRPGVEDLAAAFRLTARFLDANVWSPRGLAEPDERGRFVAQALRG